MKKIISIICLMTLVLVMTLPASGKSYKVVVTDNQTVTVGTTDDTEEIKAVTLSIIDNQGKALSEQEAMSIATATFEAHKVTVTLADGIDVDADYTIWVRWFNDVITDGDSQISEAELKVSDGKFVTNVANPTSVDINYTFTSSAPTGDDGDGYTTIDGEVYYDAYCIELMWEIQDAELEETGSGVKWNPVTLKWEEQTGEVSVVTEPEANFLIRNLSNVNISVYGEFTPSTDGGYTGDATFTYYDSEAGQDIPCVNDVSTILFTPVTIDQTELYDIFEFKIFDTTLTFDETALKGMAIADNGKIGTVEFTFDKIPFGFKIGSLKTITSDVYPWLPGMTLGQFYDKFSGKLTELSLDGDEVHWGKYVLGPKSTVLKNAMEFELLD